MGVKRVALVITSHRHDDHYGGSETILREFDVDRYVGHLGDCPKRATDNKIRKALKERGIPAQSLGADTIMIDGVSFTILPPDPENDPCPFEENNNSMVVRMDFGEFSMLFTGDAETSQREFLMTNHAELLDVDILKASHHGSRNGADGQVNGASWIDMVSPDDVVISVHRNSKHKHPHPEAMTIYEEAVGVDDIHCTSRHGTIRIFGFSDGRPHKVFHQFGSDTSCRFSQ
jgi:competence protein ComEC